MAMITSPGGSMSRRSVLSAAALLPLTASGLASVRAASPSHPGDIIDAHIHFFTDDFAHYPVDLRNAREPEDVMRVRLRNAPVKPAKMFALWEKLGIAAAVGVQYSGAYKTDNSYLLDVADAHPDRIKTEIILNPASADSVALLDTLSRTRHVSAIRLTGFVDANGDVPWLQSGYASALWKLARERQLPIGITYLKMTPTKAALETIRRLSDLYPDNILLLEHLGWTGSVGSQDGLLPEHMALKDHDNIQFKWTSLNIDALAGAGIDTAAFLRASVDVFGAHRLMWGSDYGNTTRPYAGIVADAHDATRLLNATETAEVLGGSARRLFKLSAV